MGQHHRPRHSEIVKWHRHPTRIEVILILLLLALIVGAAGA